MSLLTSAAGLLTRPLHLPVLDTPQALQRFMGAEFPLSDQQFTVVRAPLEPAVVIAGAGSGKTTLMAARVVWLVGSGLVEPHEILGLTFTTKAAAELTHRVRQALRDAGLLAAGAPARDPRAGGRADPSGPEVLEPTVATYNAYAASLLTEHGLRIGHEPDTRLMAEAARYQLAARVIGRHTREVRHLSDHQPTVVGYLLSLDAQLSEHLVSPQELLAFQDRLRPGIEAELAVATARKDLTTVLSTFDRRGELVHLVEEYRALKRSLGLMEFSDQIELGARLATTRPEVGAAQRATYKVVLLDEYQDTSVAQARMLSALFSGPTPESGRGHPVTAVGDPNQAIYGWRGASVSNILRFGESFPDVDGSVAASTYSLTVNRRSDKRILDVANALAQPLYAELPQVRPLEAKPDAADGEVRAEVHETADDEIAALPAQVEQARERYGAWSSVGVLTRDNATAAEVFRALSAADVPVEIVGLKGLLGLPEVADVVATLTLLHDLTANAALLLLLSGPRWAVGPRDLALLGSRADELAGSRGRRPGRGQPQSVAEALEAAVTGADPTEIASLSDALDDPGEPGDPGYSPEALERFALLSAELRTLRQYAGEPLIDLVRRIVDALGIDVELASAVSPAAQARRDNLDLFVKGVAEFQAIDGEVSLPALLSYLEAEEDGSGMDVATPTAADSVKLLTVHRAKGLEWDAVFLVGVAEKRFPADRTRTKWTAGPGVLPYPLRGDAADLPRWPGLDAAGLKEFTEQSKAHERQEELRLGYVAFTRARHLLSVSSWLWTTSRKDPCGPSAYQRVVRDFLEDLHRRGELSEPLPAWPEVPPKGTPNPLQAVDRVAPWPPEERTPEVRLRLAAAALVRAEVSARLAGAPEELELDLDEAQAATVADWDAEIDRLLEEARRRSAETVEVALPSSLSATALAALRSDAGGFAERLARPMPRPPAPSARGGTRFHAWVEAHYDRHRQDLLVDPDELEGRADAGLDERDDATDLTALVELFLAGPFAERQPVAVEPAFALVLGGQVVRGRIDAVFEDAGVDTGADTGADIGADRSFLVVDWKTNRRHTADPLQLAVYRLAWAELTGTPVERVQAGFYYVRDQQLQVHHGLPGREELERLVLGGPGAVEAAR